MEGVLGAVLYLGLNLFRTYVIYRFLRLFLGPMRHGGAFVWLDYGAFYFTISICYLVWNIPLLTLVLNLCGMLALSCLYDVSWQKRGLAVGSCYAILACSKIVSIFVFQRIDFSITTSNPYHSVPESVAMNLLPFIIVLFLAKRDSSAQQVELPKSYWIALFFIPAGSIYLVICLIRGDELMPFEIVLSGALLLLLNIFVFYLYDALVKFLFMQQERAILQQQNEYYQNQYQLMEASLEGGRAIRHDLKNQWMIVCGMMERNEKQKAEKYIAELIESTYGKDEFARSGCVEIDCILNFKLREAETKKIRTELTLEIPSDLSVRPSDMAVVLGNLLDNAIEGATKAVDRWIILSVRSRVGVLFIEIRNSFDQKPSTKEKTGKPDKEHHGFGLDNVRKVVNRQHGMLEIHYDEEEFRVNVLLYTG